MLQIAWSTELNLLHLCHCTWWEACLKCGSMTFATLCDVALFTLFTPICFKTLILWEELPSQTAVSMRLSDNSVLYSSVLLVVITDQGDFSRYNVWISQTHLYFFVAGFLRQHHVTVTQLYWKIWGVLQCATFGQSGFKQAMLMTKTPTDWTKSCDSTVYIQ